VGLHGGLGNSGVPLAQFVSHSFWVHFGINFQLEALQNASEEQAEALQLGY
jgi:nitrate/nitrite transporter NarK